MQHYGDITKIKGAEVPIVDVVCGGSPCQDLSVAGKRAGLAGARSGLFMEQIRIVKEMRENDRRNYAGADNADRLIRPRFMVWENVPGALSSPGKRNGEDHRGEDFQAVLTEIVRIVKPDAPDVPLPKDRRWPHAGCLMGIGDNGQPFSVAYRLHDAQFWGVPQRRKRIALVADFGGATAPEILFERESMSGDSSESGEARKGTTEDVERGVGEAIGFTNRGFESGKVTETLRSEPHGAYPMVAYDEGGVACGKEGKVTILNPSDSQGNQVADSDGIYPTLRGCGGAGYQQGYLFERKNSTTVFGISSYNSNSMKSSNPHSGIYEAATSRTLDLNGGSPACNQGGMAVVQSVGVDTYNQSIDEEVAQPLRAADGGDSTPKVCYRKTSHAKSKEDGQGWQETEVNDTLNIFDNGESRMGTGGGNVPMVMEEPYNATTGSFMRAGNSGVAETLAARDYKDPQIVCNSVVRRLTPLECERLQGFPDGWTDIGDWVDSKGKKHKGESDSPRYKALGNSIALPFWKWMAKRMRNYLGDNPTMASLFDGIGGFPLSYQEVGVKPVWASEIEEFPIAVTKIRFPDELVCITRKKEK